MCVFINIFQIHNPESIPVFLTPGAKKSAYTHARMLQIGLFNHFLPKNCRPDARRIDRRTHKKYNGLSQWAKIAAYYKTDKDMTKNVF